MIKVDHGIVFDENVAAAVDLVKAHKPKQLIFVIIMMIPTL